MFKTVTACNGRDCNERIWFWRHEGKTRKLQDKILSNLNMTCVYCIVCCKEKTKEGKRKWTFTECLLYSFLIVHESCPELARKSNRKLLYSLVLPVLQLYFAFPPLSSLCLSRTDLKRVIRLHGDARDKRKEGRRDTAA